MRRLTTAPRRVAFFGTYDERSHPRVQVLREGLTVGNHLDVVNVPLRLSTAARVELARRPWRGLAVAARVMVGWIRLLARSRPVRRPEVVVIGYLSHFDVHLARLRWPRAHLVLDYMVSLADTVRDRGIDRYPAVVKLFQWIDRAAIRQADTVLVDTPEQIELIPAAHQAKAVVAPVGAARAWLEAGRHRVGSTGPMRVVFFGLYTPLQGARTIGEAIDKLTDHDITWTMVGVGQDRAVTEAAADRGGTRSVSWRDWIDADELPRLVAHHDVCLGIFGTGAKARRVVPNKVYQGAAAGCAIVTSDTAPQRAAFGDAAVYVPPGDPDALASALASLASETTELVRQQQAARARVESHFTPAAVTRRLVARLESMQEQSKRSAGLTRPPLAPNAALRWHVVQKRLATIQPSSVLELGAGQGGVAVRLAARADYVGVEPDEVSRATAVSRLEGHGRLVDDLTDLAPDEQFDLACAFEVLEHIDDDKGALRAWVDHVRPGGHVLVSVPAEPDRFGPADEMAGHFRRYAHDDLAHLFESAGLDVVSIVHYGFPFGLVLEAGRNMIGKRRLARADAADTDIATRTAGSGRLMQPPAWAGRLIWWGTAPFRIVQGRFPQRGPGLVGLARRP
ncbi:MAG: methyltransferase domain-containing protein [Acidimicrobiales bacterium]